MVKNNVKWNMEEIITQSGDKHPILSGLLNKYLSGCDDSGSRYLEHIEDMILSQKYNVKVIEYYIHCHDSATTVRNLNDVRGYL